MGYSVLVSQIMPASAPERTPDASREGEGRGLRDARECIVECIVDCIQPLLSGPWLLTLDIRHSSLKSYEGMSATFQLYLVQDAHTVTGMGEKIKVNAKDIPPAQHQQISLKGTVSGDVVTMSYVQTAGPDGASRQTDGEFRLKILRAGMLSRQASRMEGSFSGTAASTTGNAVAIPQPQ